MFKIGWILLKHVETIPGLLHAHQPRKFEVQIRWFIVNELGMKYPMVKIPKLERGTNLPS